MRDGFRVRRLPRRVVNPPVGAGQHPATQVADGRLTRASRPGETMSALTPEATRASAMTPTPGTRTLLACGIAAGPLFMLGALVQAFTRPGFDITRHVASLLSDGALGWIQITSFVLTGLLTIACAVGMRRALPTGRGATWGPRPAGPPSGITWHGALHFACAGVGFLALIAACFVIARRATVLGQRGWAVYSRTTGVIFLAGFAGMASGASNPATVLGFWGGRYRRLDLDRAARSAAQSPGTTLPLTG